MNTPEQPPATTYETPAGQGVIDPAAAATQSDAAHQAEVASQPATPPASPPDVVTLEDRVAELEKENAALKEQQPSRDQPVVQPAQSAPPTSQPDPGTQVPVDPATATPAPIPGEPPATPVPAVPDANAQRNAEHAIAPGSHGLAVRELAQLLETLGHETYITRGENPDNVFYDDLMQLVRDVLVDHHRTTAEPHELPQLLRDVASLNAVHAPTWLHLREIADQKQKDTTRA